MKGRVDVERARTMRESGMTLQAIGDEFGVSRERIRQLVGSPLTTKSCERCEEPFETTWASRRFCSKGCQRAAQDEARMKACPCGAVIGHGSECCHECRMRTWEREREEKWARIRALWLEGLPAAEIAERVGFANSNVLGVAMARMKHAGWDLPNRRAGWKGGYAHSKECAEGPPLDHDDSRRRFTHALRSGKLTRPDACERCGRETYVDGHHFDYSKPFEVEWLCRACHMAHHIAERAAERQAA